MLKGILVYWLIASIVVCLSLILKKVVYVKIVEMWHFKFFVCLWRGKVKLYQVSKKKKMNQKSWFRATWMGGWVWVYEWVYVSPTYQYPQKTIGPILVFWLQVFLSLVHLLLMKCISGYFQRLPKGKNWPALSKVYLNKHLYNHFKWWASNTKDLILVPIPLRYQWLAS